MSDSPDISADQQTALHIVILAAGQGRRMNASLPKVLQPVAGRPMLAHVLDCATALDAAAIHVVIGHQGEAVQSRFADQGIDWVIQHEQLGTGHAVQMALLAIPDEARVLVLLGDTPLLKADSLRQLLQANATAAVILTALIDDPAGYGRIVRDDRGALKQIVEHRDASADILAINEVNSGMMCAPAALLRTHLNAIADRRDKAEIYLTDVIEMARQSGQPVEAIACRSHHEILGANDRRQLAQLERYWQRQRADELMDAGAMLADPERIDVRGALSVDADVSIDVNCVFEGSNRLEAGCRIGAGCILSNCHLGPGTVLKPYSVLEGVRSEGCCEIGPFARLRPGTQLALNTRIGNFVETKNVHLGAGSKANHLSYLGDARIGSSVNVGAGVITCNYDGVNKHQTTIGDGAFIGSDSQLVAPVHVGAGAVIGAGSTITHDTPDDRLVVSRSRQKVIEAWRRPDKKQ